MNPDYTGDSIESIDEDNTKQMMATLIHSTLYHLGMAFRQVLWPLYTGTCSLKIAGYFMGFYFLGD